MNTTELVQFVARGERPRSTPKQPATPPFYNELVGPLRCSILRARDYLFNEQQVDGSWLAHRVGDASLPSQLILLLTYLGRDEARWIPQAAAAILDEQHRDGGWSLLPDGAIDLSTSVQAYFALKLAGYEPSDDRLSAARDVIRRLGGAGAADATTRRFLALLGQVNYDTCSTVAPERLLLANWRVAKTGRQHCHQSPCWLASLAAVWALRPVRNVGVYRGVRELFVEKLDDGLIRNRVPSNAGVRGSGDHPWKLRTLRRTLSASMWKHCERWGLAPLRRRALDRAEAELLRRTRPAQISQLSFPELIWQTIALDALGFSAESRECRVCARRLFEMVHVDEVADVARPQLRTSPTADTALVSRSLRVSGVPENQEAVASATGWLALLRRRSVAASSSTEIALLVQELSATTDELPNAAHALPPNIWIGDSRFACCIRGTVRQQNDLMLKQLLEQLMVRQNRDGGWCTTAPNARCRHLDRHSRRRLRQRCRSVSRPDVTGVVVEALACRGREDLRSTIDSAVAYLRAAQRAEGSWSSNSGAWLVHGTSAVIRGLSAAGIDPDDDAISAGVNWLFVHQQPCGGWGESVPNPSDGDHFVAAGASASQTAWALSALVAAGRSLDPSARRAVQFLIDSQDDNGQWHESRAILHDPELGRWHRNDLHAVAWPLLALSQWAVAAAAHSNEAGQASLRLVGDVVDD